MSAANRATTMVAAWQAALGAEHRAYYGYGLLGPRLAAGRTALARTALAAHADLRDATSAAMVAAGVAPTDPAATYPLGPVSGSTAATALAVQLEDDCAAAWRHLYAVATAATGHAARSVRRAAQQALIDSAVRAAGWRVLDTPGAATRPFPGI